MRKRLAIISLVILFGLIIGGIYYFSEKQSEKQIEQNTLESQKVHPPCLLDNESADYYPHLPRVLEPVTISIKDRATNQEKFSFQIEGIRETFFTVQPRKCAVYVLRLFNYDPQKTKQEPGYREEIWKYTYDGEGKPIILIAEKPKEFKSYYAPVFQVDPTERYVVLIRGYLGSPDYAIIIKDLKTFEDIFVLSMAELAQNNPGIIGDIDFGNWWTKDGRYFWASTHVGAYTLGFFRINTTNWNVEVLVPSVRILGGAAFNPEYGYVTYDTGPGWIGIHEIAEQIYDEWRREGKKVDFYLYNLFTKEKILLATTDDPSWSFNPQWISDTELEYELPAGEKKIYKINKK